MTISSRCFPHLPKLYLTGAQRSTLGVSAGCRVWVSFASGAVREAEVLMPSRTYVETMNAEGHARFVRLDGFTLTPKVSEITFSHTAPTAPTTETITLTPAQPSPRRVRRNPPPAPPAITPDDDDDTTWFAAWQASQATS